MRPLLKIMGLMGLVFISLFVVLNTTGLVSMARIEGWLSAAQTANPAYVAGLVVLLLFVDLVLSVPTLATLMLAGYLIGAWPAALAGATGLLLAGICGYGLSRQYGAAILVHIVKNADERDRAAAAFRRHGPVIILLARAVPMLPEVSACMAGLTRMPFFKFIGLWVASIVPYCAVTAYAGSISTLDDPTPAILTAIGLSLFFWLSWVLVNRRQGAERRRGGKK